MNRIKYIFLIAGIMAASALFAQKEMVIESVSRTMDYSEEGKACFEILSADGDLSPRSIMEDFVKTQLSDGSYSYKAVIDLESGKKRKFYIAAPLVIEQEYNVTGLQSKEYIKIRVTIPKNELAVTEMTNLTPSKSANAIYQFLANIPDLNITASNGAPFVNKGKNAAAFYVYEMTIPVSGSSAFIVTIKATGYEELTYEVTDISQRVYGFFLFPKEECFNKNFELGNEYFRDGSYRDAMRYYGEAADCKDRNEAAPLDEKLREAKQYEKARNLIDEYDRNVKRLSTTQKYDITSGVDSVYWYKSRTIDLMRLLLKKNPTDKFCNAEEIAKREEELLNDSRNISGTVSDITYTNQRLPGVIIYGSEDPKADPKKMVKIGQSNSKGEFLIKVPNRYKILYFEHTDKEYNKPVRVNITDGKKYQYHIKLQRKEVKIGF